MIFLSTVPSLRVTDISIRPSGKVTECDLEAFTAVAASTAFTRLRKGFLSAFNNPDIA